jgi:dipeptidyl aminopeptidase/acylaminoacyl peptidase
MAVEVMLQVMRSIGLTCIVLVALVLCACGHDASPRGLTLPHPDDASKQIEYFVEQPAGPGPWPTLVLLHGHQDGARPGGRDFVNWGVLAKWAGRGYLAVAVSQPGYGQSSGPPDFSGPSTQRAVSAVIASLRADGRAMPGRLLIQGVSRGALTAGLVAAADPGVSGLVLISGAYDLRAYVADEAASDDKRRVVAALRAETGGSDEALRARSVLLSADRIKAATLILQGAQDERTSVDDAQRLAAALRGHGVVADAVIYPDHGHRIPVAVRDRDIDPFVERVLRGAGG